MTKFRGGFVDKNKVSRIIGSTQKKREVSLHAAEEMDKRKEDLQAAISALSQTNYSRCLCCTHRGRPAGTSVPPV